MDPGGGYSLGIRLASGSFVIVLFEGDVCIYKLDTVVVFVLVKDAWGRGISHIRRK